MTERHETNIHIEGEHEVEVHVNDGDAHWYRIFKAVNENGLLAKLSGGAVKVLLVLAEHVNSKIRDGSGEWLTWPSCTRIAERTGLSERMIRYALRELEKHKLVTRLVEGGGSRTAKYQLLEPPRQPIAPRQSIAGVPGQPIAGTGATHCPQRRLKKKIDSSSSEAEASPVKPEALANHAAAVADALIECGIGQPTRDRLANLDGLTPAIVQREARKAEARGLGTGALVRNLETAAEQAVRKRERQRQRREAERQVQQEIAEQREQDQAEALTGDARKEALARGFEALGRRRMT